MEILGVVYQQVGAAAKFDDLRITALLLFDVGGINKTFVLIMHAVEHDAIHRVRGTLARGYDQLISERSIGCPRRLDLRPSAGRSEANHLSARQRKNFLLAFELVERDREQVAISQVTQAMRERAPTGAWTENIRSCLGCQERLERSEERRVGKECRSR